MGDLGGRNVPSDRMRRGGPFVVSLRFSPLESMASLISVPSRIVANFSVRPGSWWRQTSASAV